MAAQQTRLIDGLDSEVITLYVELTITTTSVIDTIASAYSAFGRAFTAAPKILGVNAPKLGILASAIATASGISLYARGFSGGVMADGTLLVSATVQGRLA